MLQENVLQQPVTSLEPSISRQKLIQIVNQELARISNDNTHPEELEENQVEERDGHAGRDSIQSSSDGTQNDNSENSGLRLEYLNISNLPNEAVELIGGTIAKLSLRGNWLVDLPSRMPELSRLMYLDISSNRFTEFPIVVSINFFFNCLMTTVCGKYNF